MKVGDETGAVQHQLEAGYRAHFDFVWRTLLRLGLDESGAEDAAQEVFVVAHRHWSRLRGGAPLRPWLYGIARRVAFRARRSRARRDRAMANYLSCLRVRVGECFTPDYELGLSLQRALVDLSAEQREAFVLARLEGLTGRELASCLDINANTAAARVRAARRQLEARLGSDVDTRIHAECASDTADTMTASRCAAARDRVHAGLLPWFGTSSAAATPVTSSTLSASAVVASVATTASASGPASYAAGVAVFVGLLGLGAGVDVAMGRALPHDVPVVDTTESSSIPNTAAREGAKREPEPPVVASSKPVGSLEVPAPDRDNVNVNVNVVHRARPHRGPAPSARRDSGGSRVAEDGPPTLAPGELEAARAVRRAVLAGRRDQVIEAALSYRSRFARGIFAPEVDEALAAAQAGQLSPGDQTANSLPLGSSK